MAFSVEISSLSLYTLSANPRNVSRNTIFPSFFKPSLKPYVSKTLSISVSCRHPLSPVFSARTHVTDEDEADKPHEECGVVGIHGDPEASRLSYLALHALQHRGQEGAGIVAANQNGLESITGVGLVSDVFTESKLNNLPGDIAIGHVRYSTSGASMLKNVQPFIASCKLGSLAVVHYGNFVNYKQLKTKLEEKGSIFITSSDTELVLHLIAKSMAKTFLLRVIDACEKLRGAYSMVFVFEDKLIAVRDPFGFRPLVMGIRSNGAVLFASETCALDLIDASYEREVCPGEIVVVDRNHGDSSMFMISHPEPKQCVFEHGYLLLTAQLNCLWPFCV